MKRLFVQLSFVMALLTLSVNAVASVQVRDIDFAGMKATELAEVAQIIDPMTVQLHDGRLVRLSGVYMPDYQFEAPGQYALLARDILSDMLVGKTVQLYQTANAKVGRENRMGHMVAHIERQNDKLWVQGVLLSLGLAQARTTRFNRDMAAEMYDLESYARNEASGLWSEAKFGIVAADVIDESYEGRVHIVEGRVYATAMKNNRVYLNFGQDWRTDFTISIEPEDKRAFSRAGIDPLQWNGKHLRIRGFVDSYNGPYIKADHPEIIEVLEK